MEETLFIKVVQTPLLDDIELQLPVGSKYSDLENSIRKKYLQDSDVTYDFLHESAPVLKSQEIPFNKETITVWLIRIPTQDCKLDRHHIKESKLSDLPRSRSSNQINEGLEELQSILNFNNFAGLRPEQIKSARGKSMMNFLASEKSIKFMKEMMAHPSVRSQFVNKAKRIWSRDSVYETYREIANGSIGFDEIFDKEDVAAAFEEIVQVIPGSSYKFNVTKSDDEIEIEDLRNLYKQELQNMKDLGFINEIPCLRALKKTVGDVEKAIDLIIG